MEVSQRQQSRANEALLVLAAIGIVFGDIGTSPLYAFRECFSGRQSLPLTEGNVLGVLSMVFWSFVVVISVKYLQLVMKATNRGEGGILALTTLACFRQKREVKYGRQILLALGLFGAALLIGDGMITPAISVLSAVEGLKIATPFIQDWVVFFTIVILIALFSIQKFGTAKIGNLFGPIIICWFSVIGGLGVFSIWQNPGVLRAINPIYAVQFFTEATGPVYFVLGSVFLVITGAESLYADIGHFGRKAIQRGWFWCALPGLVLNYFGQGALLLRQPDAVTNPFYHLAPQWALLPLVVLATAAAIIASQGLISGLFSVGQQCVQLGYCPRLHIIHTSEKQIGQIYVPAVNWTLLVGTIWLVMEFDSSSNLSSAYGMGISTIMLITSILAGVTAWSLWGWSLRKTIAIFSLFIAVDLIFWGSNLLKIRDGGWVPLVIAAVAFFLMTTWKRGRELLIQRLRSRSYPFSQLLKDIEVKPPVRVPGTAIYMVGDAEMTPPALLHNLKHNKVLHETVVFLTVVGREVPHVPPAERVHVVELAPTFFRIIAYYGFSDAPDIPDLLKTCARKGLGFDFNDPTYFLGREVLFVGRPRRGEMNFWRKKVFAFLAKNAMVATNFFKLPQEDVIEVGMEIEI